MSKGSQTLTPWQNDAWQQLIGKAQSTQTVNWSPEDLRWTTAGGNDRLTGSYAITQQNLTNLNDVTNGINAANSTLLNQLQDPNANRQSILSGNQFNGYKPSIGVNQVGSSNITADQVSTAGPATVNSTQTNNFDQAAANQYMNPYVKNVIDSTREQANQDYLKNIAQASLSSAASGALGGSGDALLRAQAASDYTRNMNSFSADQMAKAYENAQTQFNTDEARRLGQFNIGEDRRLGQFNTDENRILQAGLANASNKLTADNSNVSRQLQADMTNAANSLSANTHIADLDFAGRSATNANNLAAIQAGLSTQQNNIGAINANVNNSLANQASNRATIQQGLQAGDYERQVDQQGRDRAYQILMNYTNKPQQDIQWLAQVMSAMPNQWNSQTEQLQPRANPFGQLLGAGLSLASPFF